MEKIKFTDTMGTAKEYYPKPANTFIPDWYKDLESYIGGEKVPAKDGGTVSTVKRCMPVFDALTSGYIITTFVDVYVKQEPIIPEENKLDENLDKSKFPTQPNYQWPSSEAVGLHPMIQAPNYPDRGAHNLSYPKWINPWAIRTPKGYSTLFVQPFHRESPFTILPGVVDTDNYYAPVNFPFVLKEADKFEGLIPAGTPIAQVIPFKRSSWKMEFGSADDYKDQSNLARELRNKFFDVYKTRYRQPKEYR
jgi:hypothetical protein